jgi:hypothetical protein
MSKKTFSFVLIAFVLASCATIVSAQGNLEYQPLEPLPGTIDDAGNILGLEEVLNFLFRTLFTLGGLVAVLFLVLGGITYMTSVGAGLKEKAKKRIQATLLGLGILAVSWLILNTINPELLKFDFNPGTLNSSTQSTTGGGNSSGSRRPLQIGITGQIAINNSAPSDEIASMLQTFNQNTCGGRGVHAVGTGTDGGGTYTIYECINRPQP